ncbi:MAG: sensory box/GGDEF family [Geobacteraceae bacterium]|nr:MAG: sensory box/GGDEF family [Geobacteraceae bacterium]
MRVRIEGTAWFKSLIKHAGIFRDTPTTNELEMLAEIQARLRLVVKTRWILLLLLIIYGFYAGVFYYFSGNSNSLISSQMMVLAGSLAAVVAYNLFYQLYYRELSHFLFVNHIQILLDILFVTILIHFSGGAASWFWTVYLILTLEASFLLERKEDVWLIGAAGGLIYGALLTLEYYDILSPIRMPFINPALQHDFVYEMLMWFWVSIMNATVAIIGAFLMEGIRERERFLKLMVIKDQLTNLYNRSYFFKTINNEIQRSLRYNHVFSVILLDLDNFKEYNDTYGHLEGDRLLKSVAQVFRNNVRRSETDPPYDVDVPCRYGGEEFGIILPETPLTATGTDSRSSIINASTFAERIRKDVAALDIDGQKITVSVGVAAFPINGMTTDDLVKAADDALYRAKKTGKNRVELAQ